MRQEIIERISAARDEGDLKENGGYHAAKDEQGKIEARIRQLEDMLRRAEVGETPADDGVVEPGMVVTYQFVGDDETETFLLGAREIERRRRRLDGLLARSRRWAPRSSAPKGDTVDATPRPTARSSRSRSSTRCPTPADPSPVDDRRRASRDGRWRRLACSATACDRSLGRPGSRARAAGSAPARRAARRGSRAGGAPRPRRGAGVGEIRSWTTSSTLAPARAELGEQLREAAGQVGDARPAG